MLGIWMLTHKWEPFLVDRETYDWAKYYTWHVHHTNVIYRLVKHSQRSLHRDIMSCPEGMVIDHINGDRRDNRKENLRICKQQENAKNRRLNANGTSRYKGVRRRVNGRWEARVMVNGKHVQIGVFKDEKEAARAYDIGAKKWHGEFARTNKSLGLLI